MERSSQRQNDAQLLSTAGRNGGDMERNYSAAGGATIIRISSAPLWFAACREFASL
jgi:hypothetical protein